MRGQTSSAVFHKVRRGESTHDRHGIGDLLNSKLDSDMDSDHNTETSQDRRAKELRARLKARLDQRRKSVFGEPNGGNGARARQTPFVDSNLRQPAAKRQKTTISTPKDKPSSKEKQKGTNLKAKRPKVALSAVEKEMNEVHGQIECVKQEIAVLNTKPKPGEKKKGGGLLVIGASADSEQRKELKRLENKMAELRQKRAEVVKTSTADVVGDDAAASLAGMGVGSGSIWEAEGNHFAM